MEQIQKSPPKSYSRTDSADFDDIFGGRIEPASKEKKAQDEKTQNKEKHEGRQKTEGKARIYVKKASSHKKDVKPQEKVKIIPLGGLGEIGKNMTILETENDILIIDCGMGFPDGNQPGVDLIIPDMSYLDGKTDKIRGIVVTHGHEDHIGGIPFFLKRFPGTKIIATRMTLAILAHKLNEHKIRTTTEKVHSGEVHDYGDFTVEFIKVNHSIAGAVALAIKTPAGVIFHTGDFKIDLTPIHGDIINLSRMSEYGNNGVKLLMCDSTNAERPGSTTSERVVAKQLDELFERHPSQRIIAATFASNMYRMRSMTKAAKDHGRKICFNGRTMMRISEASMDLGYLDITEDDVIDISDINEYEDEEVCLITTGSQGETMSALYRMAYDEHAQVSLTKNDLVVLSSHTIPGNESQVNDIINRLIDKEVGIAYDDNTPNIHVSGHACQEELKMVHALLKPEFFIPVHGESRHLHAHEKLAYEMGMDKEHVLITKIGHVIELTKDSLKDVGEVPSGEVYIDGNGIGDVGNIVIRDRKTMASDGIVVIVSKVDRKSRHLIGSPDVVSRGFVFMKEADELIEKIRNVAFREMKECEEKGITDYKEMKGKVKEAVSKYIYNKMKRNPMVLPIIESV